MEHINCELVFEKLRLLNYETKFLRSYRKTHNLKALPKNFFASDKVKCNLPQFYTFICLSSWLLQTCGSVIETPDETDDPSEMIDNIINEAKALGVKDLAKLNLMNLARGHGEHVVFFLLNLTETAIESQKFSWKQMEVPEVNDDPDSASLTSKKSKKSRDGDSDDDDDDSIIDEVGEIQEKDQILVQDNYFKLHGSSAMIRENSALTTKKSKKQRHNSSENPYEWQQEVERVAPKLKVVAHLDTTDWRARLDQLGLNNSKVDEETSKIGPKIKVLENSISTYIQTLTNQQKGLNSLMGPKLTSLRKVQEQLHEAKLNFESQNGNLQGDNDELEDLNEQIASIKRQTEERGSAMTDASPVSRLKAALERLRTENQGMKLQAAVLENQLTQMRIHQNSTIAKNAKMEQNMLI